MTQAERRPEQRHYARYAQDLRERFSHGFLSELLPYSQFVVWKYVMENKKLKKGPYNPRTNVPARTNDPSTWTDVNQALRALATGRYNGIGFVFAESDPFTGTDLDACVSKDGTIAAWAQEIITSLSSYTEYSPSKLGVHILTQATLEGAGRKKAMLKCIQRDDFLLSRLIMSQEHRQRLQTASSNKPACIRLLLVNYHRQGGVKTLGGVARGWVTPSCDLLQRAQMQKW